MECRRDGCAFELVSATEHPGDFGEDDARKPCAGASRYAPKNRLRSLRGAGNASRRICLAIRRRVPKWTALRSARRPIPKPTLLPPDQADVWRRRECEPSHMFWDHAGTSRDKQRSDPHGGRYPSRRCSRLTRREQWRRRESNPGPQGFRLTFVHVRSWITQPAGFTRFG